MEMNIKSSLFKFSILFSLFFFFFFFSSISFVNSQTNPSCTSDLTNLNGFVSFPTTSLHCFPVWNSQDFILRYLNAGTNLWSFILSVPDTSSYVAIGFSTDGRMIGSSAIVGWVSDTGTGRVKQYFLGATDATRVMPDEGNLKIVNGSSSIISQSSRLYLAFQLNTTQPSTRVIYSVGPRNWSPSTNSRLMQHRDQISTRLDYSSGVSKSSRPYTKLRRAHGIVNMLGWGIIILIGTIIARYFRKWDPIWFYSHAIIQLTGFILGVSGVIMGLVLEDVLNAKVDRHKTIGIFVITLGCLQVMAFLARPQKTSKVRVYWNWYHYVVGRLLIALSIANVFYGIKVGKEHNGWNAGYGAAVAILVLTAFVLEVRMWMNK